MNDALILQFRGVRMEKKCAVHRHREWVPTHDHHVHPMGMGGPDTASNVVRVCANGHYSVHAMLDYLVDYEGAVPWHIRRNFGFKVRAMAMTGYLAWKAAGGREQTRLIVIDGDGQG